MGSRAPRGAGSAPALPAGKGQKALTTVRARLWRIPGEKDENLVCPLFSLILMFCSLMALRIIIIIIIIDDNN